MKFITFLEAGKEIPGILTRDGAGAHALFAAGLHYADLLDFIRHHELADMEALRALSERPGKPLSGVHLLAPIPRPHHDVICLGLNYMSHVEEGIGTLHKGEEVDLKREDAVYFSKRVLRALGPEGLVPAHADLLPGVDYEAELAVVIGRDARRVRREEAWPHIFGLMAFNDLSGRALQYRHKQWFFGKSLDGFTAYGPYIATLDEFALPLSLRVQSRVNGETRQDSNTAQMIFPVDYIIEELSAGMTLDAGSIIATGTPAGVGGGFTPPRFLHPGDVCEIEIDGCGVLRNTVVEG